MSTLQLPTTSGAEQGFDPRKHAYFPGLIGMERIHVGEGKAEFRMTIDHRHLRPMEMAHGGVIATLLDTTLSMAVISLAPEGHYTVTVQLGVHFTRPAMLGETIVATAECQHRGSKTAVSCAEVRNLEGKLIATGNATLMYLPLAKE